MSKKTKISITLLIVLLFAGLFSNSGASSGTTLWGAVPQAEREVLIALYNGTNGDNWYDNYGWKTAPLHTDGFAMPGTENTWYGIHCDAGNTTVKGISIYGNNLNGTIPAELGNLVNLLWLGLSYNQLTGSIPAELGNLVNLLWLDLYSNQLTGSIPAELGNLANLMELDLSYNQLSGSIPPELGNITWLYELILSHNRLTGSIPAVFGNMAWLNLSSNQLTGSIPGELGNIGYMQLLDLSSNQLTGSIPPELGNFRYMQLLDLSFNRLTDSIPGELGNIEYLMELDLSYNQLSGSIPPELGNMSWLYYLNLSSNRLTGSIPGELGNIEYLTKLDLSYNKLSGSIPPELGNIGGMRWLYLASNQLSGSIPPELGNMTWLYYLYLNSNKITGDIPGEIKNLYNLQECDFRWNALYTNDAALRTFLNLRQIGGNWENYQTIAPSAPAAQPIPNGPIELSWNPIAYTGNQGGYRIFSSKTPGGPFTFSSITPSKSTSESVVTGLDPMTKYYFKIQTRTLPHDNNQNIVDSEYSTVVSATTFSFPVTISGIVATAGGPGVPGVTLIFSPPGESETTDIEGYYEHRVKPGWSGTVEPSHPGYTFLPTKIEIKDIGSNQPDQNFEAVPIPLSISGKVTCGDEGIEGVTMTFAAANGETETGSTNEQGVYHLPVPYGWAGRVTPSKGDLLFSPSHKDYTAPGVQELLEGQDYRLCVSLDLDASLEVDSTVLIKKYYAELKLKVDIIDISADRIQKFIIYRKAGDGNYEIIKELPVQQPFNFDYTDKYLEEGVTYTYIARAVDGAGKVIGESKEKSI